VDEPKLLRDPGDGIQAEEEPPEERTSDRPELPHADEDGERDGRREPGDENDATSALPCEIGDEQAPMDVSQIDDVCVELFDKATETLFLRPPNTQRCALSISRLTGSVDEDHREIVAETQEEAEHAADVAGAIAPLDAPNEDADPEMMSGGDESLFRLISDASTLVSVCRSPS
jgi:hypothetical protein